MGRWRDRSPDSDCIHLGFAVGPKSETARTMGFPVQPLQKTAGATGNTAQPLRSTVNRYAVRSAATQYAQPLSKTAGSMPDPARPPGCTGRPLGRTRRPRGSTTRSKDGTLCRPPIPAGRSMKPVDRDTVRPTARRYGQPLSNPCIPPLRTACRWMIPASRSAIPAIRDAVRDSGDSVRASAQRNQKIAIRAADARRIVPRSASKPFFQEAVP